MQFKSVKRWNLFDNDEKLLSKMSVLLKNLLLYSFPQKKMQHIIVHNIVKTMILSSSPNDLQPERDQYRPM